MSLRPLVLFPPLLLGACATATSPRPAGRSITLLHIADTHGQLESHLEYLPDQKERLVQMGGFARIKTVLDRERASTEGPVFVADGGDTFQGSAAAAWSEGEAIVAPFNALDVDVCVPGNWEVVYGPARFVELMRALRCKVLAYNMHDAASGRRLFDPHTILERGGVKVAFVGITDPTTTQRQPPEQVRGLDSTKMGGLRESIRELRASGGVDLIVAVTHTGLTVSRQLAREIPELDVILSGHTHERTQEAAFEGKVLIVEPGSMGSFVGRLDLTLAPGGGVASHDFELIPVWADQVPEDATVANIVEASLAPYRQRMNAVVGRTETTILRYDVLETSADNFVAEAVRRAAGAELGLSNGFRFGTPIAAGEIREADLWNLIPLDARLKAGWVTGRQLRDYLEDELELVFSKDPWKLSGGWGPRIAGLEMRFRAKAPRGSRIEHVTVNGAPLDDERKYRIAGCERPGEPDDYLCRLKGVHDVEFLEPTLHAALNAYLAQHPVIAPKREGSVRALDLPDEVFSQDDVLSQAPDERE